MSIASRIEAIEQHLTDDYSVLTLAGANLTNVNKNILNLKLTWKERLLYFMNNGTQVIWNNWNKVSGTGTSLTLNNTEEAPMSLVYKGNTSQSGTPTPSSPIPVQVVSGDNSIVVCGKNLFNKIYFTTKYENWPAYAVHGDTFRLIPFYVGVGTKVTFSSNVPVASSSVIYAVNELDRIQGTTQNVNINTTRTIEGGSNGYVYLGFVIIRQYYDDLLNGTYWIQIEKGETATNYEASTTYPINLGTMELCKIGDYQDYIYKEGKKWYLHKEIEEFDLSSIAFWNKNQNGDFYTMNFSSIYGFKSGECLSNIFSYSSTSWVKNCFGITTAGVLWISTKDETLTSSDLFVSYLANKNAIMYGVLATPTYETITDTTLISQLEALKKSYESVTNISQVNNDLPFELSVTALEEMN